MNTDTWILATIEKESSRLNGGEYYRLGWYDCDTGDVWEMTVDPAYKNWEKCRWEKFFKQDIIIGVYENIHKTKRHTKKSFQRASMPVVSADHAPVKIASADEDTLCEVIQILEQERNPTHIHILNRFIDSEPKRKYRPLLTSKDLGI